MLVTGNLVTSMINYMELLITLHNSNQKSYTMHMLVTGNLLTSMISLMELRNF